MFVGRLKQPQLRELAMRNLAAALLGVSLLMIGCAREKGGGTGAVDPRDGQQAESEIGRAGRPGDEGLGGGGIGGAAGGIGGGGVGGAGGGGGFGVGGAYETTASQIIATEERSTAEAASVAVDVGGPTAETENVDQNGRQWLK